MDLKSAIEFLDNQIEDATVGLPEDIFRFASRITPMVNVDLLINDEDERILLAWRDDEFAGKGWHIPGGIIRFKEKSIDRIKKVALSEIGTMVEFEPKPIDFNEIVCNRDTRGHFISFLYQCYLPKDFVPENKNLSPNDPGYLQWHEKCPKDLVLVQSSYRKILQCN